MEKQNRKTSSLNRAGVTAFLLLLAASTVLAISANGNPRRPVWQGIRMSEIRMMDIFGQNYGGADFSLVTSDLESHPADPANPAFMSIPLSLANVYINRYEVRANKADLERSLQLLEWVATNRDLWGGRDGTGSVVSYLDITLARLRAECDVGGFESRIEDLWQAVMRITAEEADAVLLAGGPPCGPTFLLAACVDSILPYPAEDQALASRAALLAAASSYLATDPRAQVWAESAHSLAERFSTSQCQTAEVEVILSQGELSKRLGGVDPSIVLDEVVRGVQFRRPTSGCSPSPGGYVTPGPVDVVSLGDSLAAAIHDSQIVASTLSERFLWQFPPGSQCEGGDDYGSTDREVRIY
jgi:hypothetical protein